jgi:uncharacterized membrane protein YfcA
MEYISFIPIGIVIATFASLLGIGGGILWAPYLILVVGLDTKSAIMISLMIQSIGMGTAMFYYIYHKMIYWRLSFGILPFLIFGLFCGVLLNQKVISGENLEIGLGLISISLAIFFVVQNENYGEKLGTDRSVKAPWSLKIASTMFGSFSGLFSIGVGDFVVPILRGKLKIPMQNSIGISHLMNFSVALTGGLTHLFFSETLSQNNLNIFLFSGIGVLIGAQIGPRIGEKIGDLKLKELFIFVLMLIGIHLIFQAL